MQGVLGDGGFTEEGQVLHVQAWVCYPSSVPGGAGTVVSSMMTGLTPALDLTASPAVIFGSSDPLDYMAAKNPSYTLFTLNNTWSPPEHRRTLLHPGDVPGSGQCERRRRQPGRPVRCPRFPPDLSAINICSEPHEGHATSRSCPSTGSAWAVCCSAISAFYRVASRSARGSRLR